MDVGFLRKLRSQSEVRSPVAHIGRRNGRGQERLLGASLGVPQGGRRFVKEQELELFEVYPEDNKFGLNMIIPGQQDVTFLKGIRIYFSVDKKQYPELNAATQGLKFYVTGKIEKANKFMITLSDVSLKFD